MTDWREELIEKMAQNISAERGWLTDWDKYNENEKNALRDVARAALAVAEPIIREQCAGMAEKRACMIDCCEATGGKIATAIREGGKDE